MQKDFVEQNPVLLHLSARLTAECSHALCFLFLDSCNFVLSASLILFADSLLIMQMDAFSPVGIGGMRNLNTRQLKLFIGNLAPSRTSRDLYRLFESYGVIRQAVVIPDRFRVRSRCYGFV